MNRRPNNDCPAHALDAHTAVCKLDSPANPVRKKNTHCSTEMTVEFASNKASPMASTPQAPTKSALSLQLEQVEQGTFVSTLDTSSNADDHLKKSVSREINIVRQQPTERLFLRKISKMISDEQWLEMDEFLRSPARVAASRSGSDLTRSIKWLKTSQGNHMNDILELTSSVNDLSLDMASWGSNDLNPMEIVHFACRFNPPRSIIRHLASLYPEGVMYPDKLGRLPLHYAAKWGSSSRLIAYLVEKDRSAASVKDNLGKTPLSLLCENYSSSIDTNEFSSEENMVESIKSLIEADPDSINIEDNGGTSAIEYAIASDSPYGAIRLIQKASERDWKERKKTSMPGEATHQHIEEQLIREDQQKQQAEEVSRETKRMNCVSTGRVHLNDVPPTRKPKTRPKYAPTA